MQKQTSKLMASRQSGDDGVKAHENENKMKCSKGREKVAHGWVETGGKKRAGRNEREHANSKKGSTWRSTSIILGHLGSMNLNYAIMEEFKGPFSVKWFRM